MTPTDRTLIHRAEQAEASSRAKSEFLAVLSHELRVSLTGIIGLAQLLNLDVLLPSQHAQVEDILKTSEHLLSLADELRDIARLETGKAKLKSLPFDFVELLEETLNVLRIEAKAKGLQLLLQYNESAPRLVKGDARVLRQIILNLVSNALKFTSQGIIFVKVNCQQQTNTRADLLISVEDTGMGIAPEQLTTLRNSLSQGDKTQDQYSGDKLGLLIINSYLKLMGATLQIQSEPKHGSSVTCLVPFALPKKTKVADQTVKSTTTSSLAPINNNRLLRILLVEDTPIVQKVYMKMLDKMGCKVDLAKNAAEALARHAQGGYDLIFMDIGLPEVSGLDITRAIRQREGKHKHTPIVAITGYAHEQDKQNCLQAGVDEVAVKPVRLVALRQLVQKWTQV